MYVGATEVDTDAARAPFGGERFCQVMNAGFRGVVLGLAVAVLLTIEPRHGSDVDD